MTLLSKIMVASIGALAGLGTGYAVFRADEKSCQAMYTRKIADIDEKFSSVPTPAGVASGQDFSIEYVVSQDAGFKGLVFKDALTGRKGVFTKVALFGNNNYGMQYADIDAALKSVQASVPLQPQVKLYVPGQDKTQ